jgi:hypothetical protein
VSHGTDVSFAVLSNEIPELKQRIDAAIAQRLPGVHY